jgi:hypothetical protein
MGSVKTYLGGICWLALLSIAIFAGSVICDGLEYNNSTGSEDIEERFNSTRDFNNSSLVVVHNERKREGRESDGFLNEADHNNTLEIESWGSSSTTGEPLLELSSEFEEIILDEIQNMKELAMGTLLKVKFIILLPNE